MTVHATTNHDVHNDGGGNARATARSAASSKEGSFTKTENTATQAARSAPRDAVEISPEARAAAKAAETYAVGSGYSAAGKSFDQVKQDMRALFDARAKETGVKLTSLASGDKFTTSGKFIVENFGDITDRRALFAVHGDTTGTFTRKEKNAAYHLMWSLREKAQGLGQPTMG